jgi:hypothetical protein
MSLIQEALQRQQEDGTGGEEDQPRKEVLPGVGPPPEMPPVPDPPTQEPVQPPPVEDKTPDDEPAAAIAPPEQTPELKAANTKKDGIPKQTIILGSVVAVAVIGGLIMMFSGGSSETEATDPTELSEDLDTSEASGTASSQDGGTVLDIEPVNTTRSEPKTSLTADTTEIQKPFVEWPVLSLSAVMGRGTTGSAMINGNLIDVGEDVDGVKFISIGNQGINLEYQGEKQFLKVGNSTM